MWPPHLWADKYEFHKYFSVFHKYLSSVSQILFRDFMKTFSEFHIHLFKNNVESHEKNVFICFLFSLFADFSAKNAFPYFYWTQVRSMSCLVSHWLTHSQCNAFVKQDLSKLITGFDKVVRWICQSHYIDLSSCCRHVFLTLRNTKPSLRFWSLLNLPLLLLNWTDSVCIREFFLQPSGLVWHPLC